MRRPPPTFGPTDLSSPALTINGNTVLVGPTGTFSTTVPFSAGAICNPIRATVTDTSNGAKAHARVVVIVGESVTASTSRTSFRWAQRSSTTSASSTRSSAATELRVSHLVADLVADDGSETVALTAACDTNVGMDLAFAPGGLGVSVSSNGSFLSLFADLTPVP